MKSTCWRFLLFLLMSATTVSAFTTTCSAQTTAQSPTPPLSTQLNAKRERRSTPRPRPASRSRSSSPRQQGPSSKSTTTTAAQRRAPHQYDHTQAEARPFVADALQEIKHQKPNEQADPYTLELDENDSNNNKKEIITHPHFQYYSLDDLFPRSLNFSHTFNTNTDFRQALRAALRQDVFDTTPTYHGLTPKARTFLLLPDSSLQGSWKCHQGGWSRRATANDDDDDDEANGNHKEKKRTKALPRMERLTAVLREYLGHDDDAPTGDEFMDTIGALCGPGPEVSTHWMDIVGVLNRRIPHSWHQDTGDSTGNKRTVLLGFPPKDNYHGVGVFSHLVKLQHEQWASTKHAINEPVLFGEDLQIPDDCIVRPVYQAGQEIIAYRDVDVLHSSPDIAHRTSVMRFM